MKYKDVWTDGLATIRKAITSANSGSALLQPVVDAAVPMLADYQNPLRVNLPRKRKGGQSWNIHRVKKDSKTNNCEEIEFPFKTIIAGGKVRQKIDDRDKDFIDNMMKLIEEKIIEFKNHEVYQYIHGQISDADFDGLDRLCLGIQSLESKSLTLDTFDEAMDLNAGNIDMIIMSPANQRKLNAQLQANSQFIGTMHGKGDFNQMTHYGIPIYKELYANNSIYFIDTDHLWVGELTPIKMQFMYDKKAKLDSFSVYCDEVLVLRNPLCLSKLVICKPRP